MAEHDALPTRENVPRHQVIRPGGPDLGSRAKNEVDVRAEFGPKTELDPEKSGQDRLKLPEPGPSLLKILLGQGILSAE